MSLEWGICSQLPVTHEVQKNFKLWVLHILLQKDKTLEQKPMPRLFLQCSRTSRLDIPILWGSLGWVQSWCGVKFGVISIGSSWTALIELEAVEVWGVSVLGRQCLTKISGKTVPKKPHQPTWNCSHCSWVAGGVRKTSRRAFTMHKSSTLRSIISCWFKVRDEPWLAWKGGNAAFLCSESCGCLYLSSTGVA